MARWSSAQPGHGDGAARSEHAGYWGEQNWLSKFLPYDASLRVPLLARWPGHLSAGSDPRLVFSLDVTATVLDAAAVEPTIPLDGDSFLGTPTHDFVFAEYFEDPSNGTMPTWALVGGSDWKYIETEMTSTGRATVRYLEYYDLATDPNEWVNAIGDLSAENDLTPEQLDELAAKVEAGRVCGGTSCP